MNRQKTLEELKRNFFTDGQLAPAPDASAKDALRLYKCEPTSAEEIKVMATGILEEDGEGPPTRCIELPRGTGGPIALMSLDFNCVNDIKTRGAVVGVDHIEHLFPLDKSPETGVLIILLQELMLDFRGRNEYCARLLRDPPRPLTILFSYDHHFDPRNVNGVLLIDRIEGVLEGLRNNGFIELPIWFNRGDESRAVASNKSNRNDSGHRETGGRCRWTLGSTRSVKNLVRRKRGSREGAIEARGSRGRPETGDAELAMHVANLGPAAPRVRVRVTTSSAGGLSQARSRQSVQAAARW